MVPIISQWASSSVPMSLQVALTRLSGMENRWVKYRMPAPSSLSGPPYWAINALAIRGFGVVMFTGYSSFF